MSRMRNSNSRGQALVLVLLALAVVLTIVLFVLSRSITDISVSSNESQSVSAFSAAEAGVEQALVVGSASGNSTQVGNASYTANVTNVAQNANSFIYPVDLNSGDNMTLWLKSQGAGSDFAGSNIKICWGKPGSYPDQSLMPGLEVVLFYGGSPLTTKITRSAFDPNARRRAVDAFATPDDSSGACSISGQAFQFQKTISLAGITDPQFAFVRLFYNTDTSQPVAFASSDTNVFPTQGILVDSSGIAAGSTRKVEVFQGWPEIPGPFQFAVYSPAGLTK